MFEPVTCLYPVCPTPAKCRGIICFARKERVFPEVDPFVAYKEDAIGLFVEAGIVSARDHFAMLTGATSVRSAFDVGRPVGEYAAETIATYAREVPDGSVD